MSIQSINAEYIFDCCHISIEVRLVPREGSEGLDKHSFLSKGKRLLSNVAQARKG